MTHSIVTNKKPKYQFDKMCHEHIYPTRQQVSFGEQFTGKSSLAGRSFCYRGVLEYNKLPRNITEINNKQTFKKKLKEWVGKNICID